MGPLRRCKAPRSERKPSTTPGPPAHHQSGNSEHPSVNLAVSAFSDHEIRGDHRFLLELTRSIAEVGDRDALGNFDDGFADLLHHGSNRAPGFVRTRTFFVEPLADAAHWRQCSLEMPD